MTRGSKETYNFELGLKCFFLFLKNGIIALFDNINYLIAFIMYMVLYTFVCYLTETSVIERSLIGELIVKITSIGQGILFPIGMLCMIFFFGIPKGYLSTKKNFWRINLTNAKNEVPLLIKIRNDAKQSDVTIMEFETYGIPLSEWEAKQDKIEAALNCHVVKIKEGKNKRRIILYTVSASKKLPDLICWKNEYLNPKSSVLVLGESLLGKVEVDLSNTPHMLIGGSSGSGKTNLIQNLQFQAILKDFDVYIVDFKGLVDFPKCWEEHCILISEMEDLCAQLDSLVQELHSRKKLLRKFECANIDILNKNTDLDLRRILLFCDELAQILDKTGLDKDQKELIAKVESYLATIARLGRAFGIHLILATQRPDANIICGQIKNNMDTRIAGRSDSVLSHVILDNNDASEKIPKDAQGRFLRNDGTVFQGYFFEITNLEGVNPSENTLSFN